MRNGIWDVWQGVIRQKLRGLGQIRTLGVQELFEFSLFPLQFLFEHGGRELHPILVIGVHHIDHEVDMKIEF